MKKVLSIITILTLFIVGNSYMFASESYGDEITLSSNEITRIKSLLSEYDVSIETQTYLMNKLENGEKWDSEKGIEPVSTHTIVKNNGTEEIVETFPDGSIAISGVDLSTAEVSTDIIVTPYDLDPGSISSGSGYTSYRGAKVYKNTAFIGAQFYADFTQVNGGMSYISRVYDEKVHALTLGGSIGDVSLQLVRDRENLNYDAEAKLSFVANAWAGGTNCYLKLVVGKGTYSTPYSY
ncbi:hypothetical protein [Paenibacillus sp. JZ16]|uniref:hypothetical protein n=1 Tax=Paenibacillus sp. JZ16 TaxID=1906272 RepID=UPI00188BC536|nr:hypothetical protein [Paenibacillus sp. JZ16]